MPAGERTATSSQRLLPLNGWGSEGELKSRSTVSNPLLKVVLSMNSVLPICVPPAAAS
jgi:hypothetical protein